MKQIQYLTALVAAVSNFTWFSVQAMDGIGHFNFYQRWDIDLNGEVNVGDALFLNGALTNRIILIPPVLSDANYDGVFDEDDPMSVLNAIEYQYPAELSADGPGLAVLEHIAYKSGDANAPFNVTVTAPDPYSYHLTISTNLTPMVQIPLNADLSFIGEVPQGDIDVGGFVVKFENQELQIAGYLTLSFTGSGNGVLGAICALKSNRWDRDFTVQFFQGDNMDQFPMVSGTSGYAALLTDGENIPDLDSESFSFYSDIGSNGSNSQNYFRESRKTTATDIEMFGNISTDSMKEADATAYGLKIKPLGDRVLVESTETPLNHQPVSHPKGSFTLPGIGKL